jgi:hypothetical protein
MQAGTNDSITFENTPILGGNHVPRHEDAPNNSDNDSCGGNFGISDGTWTIAITGFGQGSVRNR